MLLPEDPLEKPDEVTLPLAPAAELPLPPKLLLLLPPGLELPPEEALVG